LVKILKTIGITSRLRQNQTNLGLMCSNLATGIAGSFAQHWIRRRAQWSSSFKGMTFVYACWTASSAVCAGGYSNDHASRAVVTLIFVNYGTYNLMMPLAYTDITEVSPYLQKAMALMLIFSRLGSAFNAFGWRLCIMYTCWLTVKATYIFSLYPR
jgi:hypothetical protein